MDYSHFAILLLFFALALFAAEIFVPSGGVITVIAMVAVTGSFLCAWNAWWGSNQIAFWFYVGSVVALIPATLGGALYALPHTSIGRRVLLEAPELDEVAPYVQEQAHLSQMLGRTGKTMTMLNPGGFVLIDRERLHCESEGMIIDPQCEVRVIGIDGNRLIVRPTQDESTPPEPFISDAEDVEDPRLDFDVPQS